jgi:hypothetical protein
MLVGQKIPFFLTYDPTSLFILYSVPGKTLIRAFIVLLVTFFGRARMTRL